MSKTKIEWADYVINPIQAVIKGSSGRGYHCTKISPGCLNCYAETINNRFGNHLPFDGQLTEFELVSAELQKLQKWKKPRSVFIQSMGDLFHESVPDRFVDAIWAAISKHPRHTALILTKRPFTMSDFVTEIGVFNYGILPNLYLGFTVCTQKEWDEKGKKFLGIPGNKFLSLEPMLEEIKLKGTGCYWCFGSGVNPAFGTPCPQCFDIQAVILGGETGPKARPMNPSWVRSVKDQCKAAFVPFFFKSWGEWSSEDGWYLKPSGIGKKSSIVDFAPGVYVRSKSVGKIGKKAAGRVLDGVTHDELPWAKEKPLEPIGILGRSKYKEAQKGLNETRSRLLARFLVTIKTKEVL